MPNVTLAFDEELLARGQGYARKHNLSFNAFVRELVDRQTRPQADWLEDAFALADAVRADSQGAVWTRDEIHERH